MRDDTASTRRGFIKGAAAATAVAAGVTGMISKAGARVPPLFNGITRAGQHPSGSPTNPPPPKYEARREAGLLIERDIAVRLRDGVRIYVDIYRPDGPPGEKDLPVIIGWGPYGKHTVGRTYSRESGVRPEWVSKYTGFEGVNPLYWCPRGYAVLYPNPRGTWHSEGDMHHGGITESMDCYDLIEWAGVQPWCNGKVGMSGVSYLAAIQYQVAPLSAAAPRGDQSLGGLLRLVPRVRLSRRHPRERLPALCRARHQRSPWAGRTTPTPMCWPHPLYDEFWESRGKPLEDIKVPAFVVASWTDQGFHTRGTLEASSRCARSRSGC